MREIKFRGYAPNYKSWRYGCLDVTKDGKCFIKSVNERGAAERTRVDEDSIGQYINLKDCKNNPIYESDILEDGEGIHYTVYWDYNHASFRLQRTGCTDGFGYYDGTVFEIVGNIYEESLND